MSRAVVVTVLLLTLFSCHKSIHTPSGAGAGTSGALLFSVGDLEENAIPADFTGLSFETHGLCGASYFSDSNTVLINLLKQLGPGIIRIGGNSVDRTYWVSAAAPGVDTGKVLTNRAIDRFFHFASATGWRVMFGLNLGTGTARYAANEASYISSHYKDQLLYFEIGNEPDLYNVNGLRPSTYTYENFRTEFIKFRDSLIARDPDAPISGPTTATHTDTWLVPFAKDEHTGVSMVTQHYYYMGPPSDPSVTIPRLLENDYGITSQANTMAAAANAYYLPYRISECNSVFSGGKTGVSNTLASAIWGLDFMFTLAKMGASGVNFHGGGTSMYSPIALSGGRCIPKPLYYGMLFFAQTANGRFLKMTPGAANRGTLNATAYAIKRADGAVLIALINKDLTHTASATFSLSGTGGTGGTQYHSAQILRLEGPSPDAQDSVSLGGAFVDSRGQWTSPQAQFTTISGGQLKIDAAPCSAVLVTIR